MMAAVASEPNLLISKPDSQDVSVSPIYTDGNGCCVYPMRFFWRGKRKGDLLIDPECNVFEIISYQIIGIASPRETEANLLSYFVDTIFGALFLNPLVKIKLDLAPLHKWDLPTVKRHVVELVERNPDAYVHETGTRLRRLIATCKSVRCIGAAIMGNPTPNES
jgi:hypothetical protein